MSGYLIVSLEQRGQLSPYLFPPEPHHDAQVVSEGRGGAPIAGMFCVGKLGPIGGHNFIHGFTTSIVLPSNC